MLSKKAQFTPSATRVMGLSLAKCGLNAEHDRSSFVDASSEHNDLYSAIRKFIRPNAFDVHHEGHHKEHKTGAVPAAEATVARKKAKKTPKATPAPTKPPKAAVTDDEEEYDYEEEEE